MSKHPFVKAVFEIGIRLTLAIIVAVWIFLSAQSPSRSEERSCPPDVSSMASIMTEMEAREGPVLGRVVIDVFSAHDGRASILTVVFERRPLAQVYTFLDDCLVSATNQVPADLITDGVLRRKYSEVFPPADRGL